MLGWVFAVPLKNGATIWAERRHFHAKPCSVVLSLWADCLGCSYFVGRTSQTPNLNPTLTPEILVSGGMFSVDSGLEGTGEVRVGKKGVSE